MKGAALFEPAVWPARGCGTVDDSETIVAPGRSQNFAVGAVGSWCSGLSRGVLLASRMRALGAGELRPDEKVSKPEHRGGGLPDWPRKPDDA